MSRSLVAREKVADHRRPVTHASLARYPAIASHHSAATSDGLGRAELPAATAGLPNGRTGTSRLVISRLSPSVRARRHRRQIAGLQMLVISRKAGQSVLIGDDIEVAVLEVQGGVVKLGVNASKDKLVLRSELRHRSGEDRGGEGLAGMQSAAIP